MLTALNGAASVPTRGAGGAQARRPRSNALGLPLLTFLAVVVCGGIHFRDELFAERPQHDLATYLRAFDLVEAGGSPYADSGYLYTPAFAVAGNALYRWMGAGAFILAFRFGLLLGVWILVWISLRPVRWPWPAELGAALLLVWSTLLDNGIHCANATPLLAGWLAAALLLARRQPVIGGLLAGTLNGWKPFGVTALAAFAVPERGRPLRRGPLLAVVAACAAIAAWQLVGWRYLPSMLSRLGGIPEQGHHLSIHAALFQLGIHVPAVVLFLAVSLLGCGLVYLRATGDDHRLAVGMAFSAMALPVVNPNTLLMSVPLQALALDRAVTRLRAPGGQRRRAAGELAIVVAATVGIHGALGTVIQHDLPLALGGLLRLVPHLEIALLAVYTLVWGAETAAVRDQGTERGLRAPRAAAPGGA